MSKKIDYDKETGEILAASSILDIDEEKIREEEALDGYYMLLTSEMEASDDEIIDMYRGLWRIEESFKVTKSELEARPRICLDKRTYRSTFSDLFCSLDDSKDTGKNKLERKIQRWKNPGTPCQKQNAAWSSKNYYLFDYYDEILKEIGLIMDIDFGKTYPYSGRNKKNIGKD